MGFEAKGRNLTKGGPEMTTKAWWGGGDKKV